MYPVLENRPSTSFVFMDEYLTHNHVMWQKIALEKNCDGCKNCQPQKLIFQKLDRKDFSRKKEF